MDQPAVGQSPLEPLQQPQARVGADLLAIEQREIRRDEIHCHSRRMSRILAAINLATPADVTMIPFRKGNLGRTISRRARYPAVARHPWHNAIKARQSGEPCDPGLH